MKPRVTVTRLPYGFPRVERRNYGAAVLIGCVVFAAGVWLLSTFIGG